ncbi:hypothetical protein [Clostridium lacusfryxellense]|uniref:hypothetical protein n=1 Tax=Clostridium lacusfryxellense TaxID=205328 RepID=UPI001C0B80F3|nr:hypothetical protein [Clostridium lacusfryxellense]MBU3113764.1 hypothetical protein [Clostridium lacusfryxellense]
MEGFKTSYGMLNGISSIEFYNGGAIKECKLNKYSEMKTIYGKLVPQYDGAELRRKYKRSLSFYENGSLQSISFQKQTTIDTSIGKLPAELAVFYENGKIKRIFPLNGKMTAYWTEQNEYKLAEELNFSLEFGAFKKKIIGISFYESDSVKSLTLWPKDFIEVLTPCGIIETRIGVSLYPNGAVKSCEPRKQTMINTIIGELHAFDVGAIGINGDVNSLNFNEDGTIKSLRSSLDKISIKDIDGQLKTHEPGLKTNRFNPLAMDVVPMNIQFYEGKIKINEDEYIIKENEFYIDKYIRKFLRS